MTVVRYRCRCLRWGSPLSTWWSAGRDGGRDFSERAVRVARAGQPGLVDPRVRADRQLKDLVGLCNALAAVITHRNPLSADAFAVPSALPSAPDEQVGDLPARVLEAEAVLTALRDALVAGHDLQNVATRAADFGIRVPDLTLLGAITDDQRTALRASVETRLAAASGTPRRIVCARSSAANCLASFRSRHPTRRH